MIFVVVSPMDHAGKRFQPGDIIHVGEEEFMVWTRDLQRAKARMVMSQEDAQQLRAAILDGSFVAK